LVVVVVWQGRHRPSAPVVWQNRQRPSGPGWCRGIVPPDPAMTCRAGQGTAGESGLGWRGCTVVNSAGSQRCMPAFMRRTRNKCGSCRHLLIIEPGQGGISVGALSPMSGGYALLDDV